MRLARTARIKGEGGIALLVIVLLLVGGAIWWLYSSRRDSEKNARVFATEVAKRMAINYDEKFLHVHLSPAAQAQYLRSARDRMLGQLREFGVPAQPIDVEGDVAFSSYFFDPHAIFLARLKYPTTNARLELGVSRGMAVWQLDSMNLTWDPPPTPTPGPVQVATPTPTPSPAPLQQKRKRRG